MIEVTVPGGYAGPSGRTNRAPLSTWTRRGFVRADGARLSGDAPAGLLLPAGPDGPGFLTFRNFDAIYAYNHADSYALAIAHLADRLAGHPAFRTRWPTDDPGLSRAERLALQKLLLARGFDIGEADGKIGPATRAAIAEAEKSLGLPPTGRAGRKVYRTLRDASGDGVPDDIVPPTSSNGARGTRADGAAATQHATPVDDARSP
jgi:hypothetical protein